MVESIDGRYSFGDIPISVGGQARVFRGFDHITAAPVAIKVFDLGDRDIDDVHLATWQLELKAYQSLPQHDHLTRVQAFGRFESGIPYIVLEWLEGDLLSALPELALGGWDDFWPIARDILTGLSVIHRHGYIHRDIKPKNVLITPEKHYKLADFGTARLRPESDFVNTFAFHGSQPFSAPEFGTLSPTPAYDVYSFAVLAVSCLSRASLTTPHEVLDAFATLDLPDGIRQLLESCLAFSPEDRPESATILLRQLSKIQASRENRTTHVQRLHLEVPASVLSYFAQVSGNDAASVDDLLSEFQDAPRFEFDKSAESRGDIRIAGRSLVAYASVGSRPWLLRLRRLIKPFRRHLDEAHQSWWKPTVELTLATPTDATGAGKLLAAFSNGLHGFEATQLAATGGRERNYFAQLGRILDAKEHLTNHSQRAVQFTAARRQGRRVYLKVSPDFEVVPNEPRLIRDAFKQRLFCEVETVTNQELVLYVTRGELRELPQVGTLEIDSELTRSKLRRERNALDAVRSGRSSRSDLGDLLVAPNHSRVAVGDSSSIQFANSDLDDDKKLAVAKSLDLKDLLVVEGPPGTGKTTYIAELIGQQLASAPGSKILLAAQTHIALDNALSRVQEQNPSARFLRIGSLAKLDSAAEPWSIPAQLSMWRDECLAAGDAFLEDRASSLGVSSGDDSRERVASQLERDSQRESELLTVRETLTGARRTTRLLITERDSRIKKVIDHLDLIERAAAAAEPGDLDATIEELIERGLSVVAAFESTGNLGGELVALDAQLERVREEFDATVARSSENEAILRAAMGNETQSREELVATVLFANGDSRKQISQLREILADWTGRLDSDPTLHAVLLARADIVATTCVALTGVKGASEVPFDLCLVDEASKASSTELLVPLANSKRWILVGDDKQLPPFVERELEDPDLLARFQITKDEITDTLFTRLTEHLPVENRITLTKQHRMQPDIGNLISRVFYGGRLKSPARAPDPLVLNCLGAPVTWLDTRARHDRRERARGTTVENRGEAKVIMAELIRLNKLAEMSGQSVRRVALLSGYEAQSRLLTETLAPHAAALSKLDVQVATIDSFQGQEADICFFSLTRSNVSGELGFLRSAPRLNVALSRARDGLVIVGDGSMLSDHDAAKKTPLGDVWCYVETGVGCQVRTVEDGR